MDDLRKIALEIRIAAADVNDKTKREVMSAISEAVDALPDDGQKMEIMKRMLPVAPNEAAKALFVLLLGPVEEAAPKREDENIQLMRTLTRYKRELKFNGSIGDSDEDDLDYISLCSQIEDWKKKDYTDEEIAIGVRKVVSPTSDLRSYFDA